MYRPDLCEIFTIISNLLYMKCRKSFKRASITKVQSTFVVLVITVYCYNNLIREEGIVITLCSTLDSPNPGTPLYSTGRGAGKFFNFLYVLYYQLELFPLALPYSPAGSCNYGSFTRAAAGGNCNLITGN